MWRAVLLAMLLCGCAASSHRAAPPPPRLAEKSPDEFGRQMVASLAKGNADEAMQLYISRAEHANRLNGSGYDRQRARVAAAVNRLTAPLEGAKFVAIYMRTRDPEMLQPGGDPNVKLPTPAYRESRIWASAGGKLYEIDVNTLLQVGGSWRFIAAPTLRAR